jgi:aspartate kinase
MPRLLVLKFGGTALGSARRVERAARTVERVRRAGHSPVVVVSANGHRTDHLLRSAQAVAPSRHADRDELTARERARLLATGEDQSAALLALALIEQGIPVRSLRGQAAGLVADGPLHEGTLRPVDPASIVSLLSDAIVPIVSGFHAQRPDGETILLGRGSSDLVAIGIAAALRRTHDARTRCLIITDVDGVYTADPRTTPQARRYSHCTFDTVVTLAERGDQVVHTLAASLAHRTGTPFHVVPWQRPLGRGLGTLVGARSDRLASAPESLAFGCRA